MKNLSLIIILFSVFFTVQSQGRTPADSKQQAFLQLSREDAALISEAYHLQKTLGNQIWSGWSELKVPILYITQENEYAINFSKPMSGFESSGSPFLSGNEIKVRKRTFDTNLMASFDIDGVNAVVVGSPEGTGKTPTQWTLMVVHEMFHVYQAAHGSTKKIRKLRLGSELDASWQLNYPFPYNDADVIRLFHLQGYPLYLGITDKNESDAKYNAGVVLEAIQTYRSLLKVQAVDEKFYRYSQFQETIEGIGRYTEYRMAEAAAGLDYQPEESFRQLADFKSYKKIWEENYENQLFPIKHLGRAVRSRTTFYYLGLGKGLLLDRLMPDWKKYYFEENVWLDDLLAKVENQQK